MRPCFDSIMHILALMRQLLPMKARKGLCDGGLCLSRPLYSSLNLGSDGAEGYLSFFSEKAFHHLRCI